MLDKEGIVLDIAPLMGPYVTDRDLREIERYCTPKERREKQKSPRCDVLEFNIIGIVLWLVLGVSLGVFACYALFCDGFSIFWLCAAVVGFFGVPAKLFLED